MEKAIQGHFNESITFCLRQKQTIEALWRERAERLQNLDHTRNLSPQKQLSLLPSRDLPIRDLDLPSRRREYLQQLRKDVVETTRYGQTQGLCREQIVHGVGGLCGAGPGEWGLQLPLDRSDSKSGSYAPVGKWRWLGKAGGEWGKGKKEDVEGNRVVGTELMGESGQSGCDLLYKTAVLNLKMGCKTKLWSKRRWVLQEDG